jgi:hypothetical protein
MISHGRVLKEDVVQKLKNVRYMFDEGSNNNSHIPIDVGSMYVVVTKDQLWDLPHHLPELPDACYVGGAEQTKVFEAIAQERKNQEDKWGENKPQSLPGYLLILESELNEAKLGWIKNLPGKSAPLNELVQLAAVAVACLERYGLTGNAVATDDIPDSEHN